MGVVGQCQVSGLGQQLVFVVLEGDRLCAVDFLFGDVEVGIVATTDASGDGSAPGDVLKQGSVVAINQLVVVRRNNSAEFAGGG